MTETADLTAKLTLAVNDYNQALDRAADKTKEVGEAAENAGEKIDGVGKTSKSSSKEVGTLDSAVDTLSKRMVGLVSVGALIGAVQWTLNLQDAAIETQNALYTMSGSTDQLTKSLDAYNAAVRNVYGDEQSVAEISTAVSRSFEMSTKEIERTTQAYQNLSETYGVSGGSLVYDTREIWAKWGIPDDEAIARLGQLNTLTSTQVGDPTQNLQRNIAVLRDYDDILKEMGYSYEDTLSMLGAWSAAEQDASENLSLIQRQYAAYENEIGQAPAKISALTAEYEKLTAAGEDTTAVQEEIAKLTELSGKSAGDLTRELIEALGAGGTAPESYAMITGRDRTKLIEAAQASLDVEDFQYELTEGEIAVRKFVSALDELNLIVRNFSLNASEQLSPGSATNTRQREFSELYQAIAAVAPDEAKRLSTQFYTGQGNWDVDAQEAALGEARQIVVTINQTFNGQTNPNDQYAATQEALKDYGGHYTGV